MIKKYFISLGVFVATITACGSSQVEQTQKEQNPQNSAIEDYEEACGDVAEADHIVISKESMSLKLYDKNNLLICRFPISLGSNYGDKQEMGDMKTPEGDFAIVQIQRASHWMYNSGKEKIKNYYGNWFIRLNTEYRGIGIHGTHEPERIGERSTEGSIRLNNYHLDSLRTMVDVGMAVRIESSRLDREADGKGLEIEQEPTLVAESATPVIEEHAAGATTEVSEVVDEGSIATTEVPAPTRENSEGEEWYTIKDGDIVGRIAAQYGTTTRRIKELNPDINIDRISIGQKIRVKGNLPEQKSTTTAIVTEESNSNEVWHTVVDGDLVGRIASQYGTTTRHIKELNPELNPDRISIGQRIRVK